MINTVKNDILEISASAFGAELQSVKYKGEELLWQDTEGIWNAHSPILFPIVGRLKNDRFTVDGKEYVLTKHGFARDSEFSLERIEKDLLSFVLVSNDSTRAVYPYDFQLRVTYTLGSDGITMSYQVLNTSDRTMYFSMGAHPAFSIQMGDYLEFEKVENADALFVNENSYISRRIPYLVNTNKMTVESDTFADGAVIFNGLKSRSVTLNTRTHKIKVDYADATYLGIWAKRGAPYVCIEPWFGVNDFADTDYDFSEKPGILALDAGGCFDYSVKISFEKI